MSYEFKTHVTLFYSQILVLILLISCVGLYDEVKRSTNVGSYAPEVTKKHK